MPTSVALTTFAKTQRRSLVEKVSAIACATKPAILRESERVASSTGFSPWTSLIFIPRSRAPSTSCLPMPCTSTTFIPRLLNTAMSVTTFAKFGPAIIAPSMAITKVWSRYIGTYSKIPRKSEAFMLTLRIFVLVFSICGNFEVIAVGSTTLCLYTYCLQCGLLQCLPAL